MMTVYKYPLRIAHEQTIKLPEHAEVLSVCEQHEGVVLYAMVDKDRPAIEPHTVCIVGTDYDAPDLTGFDFVGTCNLHHGLLMFHVFVRKEAADGAN